MAALPTVPGQCRDPGQGRRHLQVEAVLSRGPWRLAEAVGPAPKFAAVVCEDIERSARDTFNALTGK